MMARAGLCLYQPVSAAAAQVVRPGDHGPAEEAKEEQDSEHAQAECHYCLKPRQLRACVAHLLTSVTAGKW